MDTSIGYNKPLYILPFDHRASFEKGMFGVENGLISDYQKKKIIEEKEIIYEAFKKVVDEKNLKNEAAILVDEEFGDVILKDAKTNGYLVCLTTEKSGQEEFDFEYEDEFEEHIEKYKPTFIKALIRFNPEGDLEVNKRQEEKLKTLNNYCKKNNYKFLLEVLLPPTKNQLEQVNNELIRYEEEIKPSLTAKTILLLRNAGVNPDVWKLEGMNKKEDYEKVVLRIKENGGENVGVVILGRGESREMVEKWIIQGAGVKEVTGFAIGRTIFWQPLVDYKENKLTKEETIDIISKNYKYFYQLFLDSKNI